MQERSPLLTKPEERCIPCDYSRAAQSVCEPSEVVCGSTCGCVCCLGTPLIMVGACLLCCFGANISALNGSSCGNKNNNFFTVGYDAGAFLTRTLTRILGFCVGMICLPCEKYSCRDLKMNETSHTTNKSILFSCVSKEKIEAVDYCARPYSHSPCYTDTDTDTDKDREAGPAVQQML